MASRSALLDTFTHGDIATDHSIERRRRGKGVIYEGEDGLFSQTWWPLCRSSDLEPGAVIGRNFLDGRVAIFRTENGLPSVVSAYCPHNGADLSVGTVCGSELRCAFHHWQFNLEGQCVKTGSGDPVNSRMRLFHYPTTERFGLIWAFNGVTPLFELPELGRPDDELTFHAEIPIIDINVDPWVFMCNTLDFNHIKCVHRIAMDQANPEDDIRWHDYGYDYEVKAHFEDNGAPLNYNLGILGTNIFIQHGTVNGRWFAFFYPCGMHRPGTLRSYVIVATTRSDGSAEDNRRVQDTLEFAMDLEIGIVKEDYDILNSIRFERGMLTRSDKALGKFLRYLRMYPRAHPGANFIK